ncbi:MAG: hypothetical protein GWN39_13085, partial [Thermoplasmata archaeon]|nr:hypothetical protein [Thermoplasmata archaeon]NIS12984.1 hypothetical protein [Thermoplasmata archaeon]NIV79644.1 hypothetical protein [Thermoplasmata archaeon]NIW89702.1 hypothetical protein [Thermoplasmata archaeon]
MSRRMSIMVVSLVAVLLLSSVGCIEVKDKPPQGPFVIELDTEEMFFIDDSGGHLEGPHAHVETEIAHAHEEYAWDIEGLGEFEGAEVELPAHEVGVRKASYNIHFIDQENHTGLSVATVPDLSGIYFVIGDGIGLEEGDHDEQTLDLEVTPGVNLTEVSSHEGWSILEYAGRLSDPWGVMLFHNYSNTGNVTYLVGTHVKSGDVLEEDVGSIRIQPGETHILAYLEGELHVTIWKLNYNDAVDTPEFDGLYDELPKEYRTHIGKL